MVLHPFVLTGFIGSGSKSYSSRFVSSPLTAHTFKPQKWRGVFFLPTIFKNWPWAMQFTEIHAPAGASSILPHSVSPTNTSAPASLLEQQSPLFKTCTLVTVYIYPNSALHQGPSLSGLVCMHVNYPLPQLALKSIDLIGFHGLFLQFSYFELIVTYFLWKLRSCGTISSPFDEV